MKETANLKLPLYELDDPANLADGYNNAMEKLDAAVQAQAGDIAAYFPVTTANIENGAVTTNKLATAAVTGEKIANESITNEKLSPDFVFPGGTPEPGSITLDMISSDAFDTEPTEDSDKLLDSGAVWTALQNIPTPEPEVTNKNVLVIGDSFSDPDFANTWVPGFKAAIGAEVYNYAKGGAGWVAKGSTGTAPTFYEQLQTASQALTASEKSALKSIIVYGGINDFTLNKTTTEVSTAINTFNNAVYTLFPSKPKVYVCSPNAGYPAQASYNNFLPWTKSIIEAIASCSNLTLVRSACWWLVPYNSSVFNDDKLHPSASGRDLLLKHFISLYYGDIQETFAVPAAINYNGSIANGGTIDITVNWESGVWSTTGSVSNATTPVGADAIIIPDSPNLTFGNYSVLFLMFSNTGIYPSGIRQQAGRLTLLSTSTPQSIPAAYIK